MANPRKFSEKIALHNQKQAEETAAFERIMQEVSVTRQPHHHTFLNPHSQPFLRHSSLLGGSLPNVNQMSGPPMEMPMRPGLYEEYKPLHYRHQIRFDRPRPYNMPRRPDFQNRHPRYMEGVPGGPYSGPYLSPPADTSWRRTNSDSALHQSVMNPNSQETFSSFNNAPTHHQGMLPPPGRDMMDMSMTKMPTMDAEKLHQQFGVSRPKSCENNQMNVLSNAEVSGGNLNHRQGLPQNPTNPGLSHVAQIGNNTGSLPDLTNLHIPSPLSNPIDYDDHQQKQMSQNHQQPPASMLYNQARSTGNLAAASAMNPHIGGYLESVTTKIYNLLAELEGVLGEQGQQGRVTSDEKTYREDRRRRTRSATGTSGSYIAALRKLLGMRRKSTKEGDNEVGRLTQMVERNVKVKTKGLSSRGNPASPCRSRRHTHNGPSPLSMSSPDQHRRIKFHGLPSPKLAGIKPDLKSPPIGGSYPYPYPLQSGMDNRTQGPIHQQMRQHLQHTPSNAHPVLRVDVNAASKVGQYPNPPPHPHAIAGHRSGPNMTSPITSPTSPTSRCSLSPGASPQHLPEMTSTSNPSLSEAYYRSDLAGVHPLQYQFEQFHVVSDIGSTSGMPHTSMPPPIYSSSLQLLEEGLYPQNSTYGLPSQRGSDSSIYTYNNGSNSLLYKNLISPTAKIPDIVFTGVDDGQSMKAGTSGDLHGYMGSTGLTGSEFGTDYFPGDDLKCNLGLEELQMLAQDKLIEDPSMEDELR